MSDTIERIKKKIDVGAQEDDLKQCYSCEFATKQQRKRLNGKVA